ncbi:MAG: ornithine carbamoyltransferase [Chloroflexi bacterium]|nr:ornithine carbamoyltransferase [Chloroflexota bacterium]
MPGKDLVSLADWSAEDLTRALDLGGRLKADRAGFAQALTGRILALVFQKPSLRTRVSFEVGMSHLGGHAMYLSNQELGLGQRESVPDAAKVLSRMVDGIVARTFDHLVVEQLAEHATVPVVNGLSDFEHPCQILADVLTMREHSGQLQGLKVAWVGDGNNVTNSLMLAAARFGFDLDVATPPCFEPDAKLTARARREAEASGATIRVLNDPRAAVDGADYVYTDAWYSMGQESERDERRDIFRPYQVNAALMAAAGERARAMHCLPAHRGEEITDDVLDGDASVALDQAENRVHAQKAVLVMLLGDRPVPA